MWRAVNPLVKSRIGRINSKGTVAVSVVGPRRAAVESGTVRLLGRVVEGGGQAEVTVSGVDAQLVVAAA
jgi:hypothetical protein